MRLLCIFSSAAFVAVALATAARAQAPDTSLWAPDGYVSSMVRLGSSLHIGGQFTTVAPVTGAAVAFDAVTAERLPGIAAVASSVNTVLADGAGGWFVGGSFHGVSGQSRRNLVHLLANGQVAAWAPDPDSAVFALALLGNTLYVGGRFEHLGGAARFKIGAVDVTTGLATVFDPSPPKPAPTLWPIVFSLVTAPGVVYAGGIFSTIGGQSRNAIAALDPTTGTATAWNAQATGGRVQAIALAGSTLYVGGSFSSMGGQPRFGLAELSVTTGTATSFVASVNGGASALAISGSTLYVGGGFNAIGGQPRVCIGAIDRATSVVTAFDPNPASGGNGIQVTGLALDGSRLYVAGRFLSIGGQSRRGLAALNAGDGIAQAWDAHINGVVTCVATSGSVVFAAGGFGTVGGVARANLAAIDLTTHHPTSWAPTTDLGVNSLATDGTSIYVAGEFSQVNGLPHPYVARVQASGVVDGWNPHVDNVVNAIAVNAGSVYLGGYFSNINSQQLTSRTVAVDAITGGLTGWMGNTSTYTPAGILIEPSTGDVLVAAQSQFFRLSSVNGSVQWSASTDNWTNAVAVIGSTIYLGGTFGHVAGVARNNLAAFSLSGALLPWAPEPNGTVLGLAEDGAHVYACGIFTQIGGQPRTGLAVLDPASGISTSYDAHMDAAASQVVVVGSDLYLSAGGVSFAGGFPIGSLVRLPGAPPLVAPPVLPRMLELSAAPVPASTHTVLRWSLPAAAHVWLDVLDVQGRRVAEPFAGLLLAAGEGSFTLRTHGWSPGVYLVRLQAGAAIATRRIVVSE